jgi:hypothetical protein
MVEKPVSGDEEQRREQTRAAREQSGLPPEDTNTGESPAAAEDAGRARKHGDNPAADTTSDRNG